MYESVLSKCSYTDLHEGLLEGQELAELDGGGKDGDGEDVVVVRVDGERGMKRDVLVAPEMVQID